MALYRVTWTIDLDADTPREAAQRARDIQLSAESTATVFEVAVLSGAYAGDAVTTIDLGETE